MGQPPDVTIDELAQPRLGLVSRPLLIASGFSDAAIKQRVATGRLVPVQEGVYRTFGTTAGWSQTLLAACLAAGPDAVASHRAAAHVWGLLDESTVIELTVPSGACPVPRRTRLHRSTDLDPAHTTVRNAIPVTKPARTLVDLGAVAPFPVVALASEIAVTRGLASVAAQHAMLREVARRGRRGCGVLRAVLDQRALKMMRSSSILESFFARLVQEFGIEQLEYQVVVVIDGQRRFLDFAIKDALLGIEIDGDEFHGTLSACIADRRRTNSLATVGYQILRYGSDELRRTPRRVLNEIAEVARQRRALLCRSLSP